MVDLLLLLSSLLLSFAAFSSSSSSPSPPFSPFRPVTDVNGHELKLGKPYYVLSGPFLHPVGLCLTNNDNINHDDDDENEENEVVQCSLFKARDPRGLPVIFSTEDDDENNDEDSGVVRESTFYRVQFSVEKDDSISDETSTDPEEKRRNRKTAWYLRKGGLPNQMFVATGSKSRSVRFAIKKTMMGYKIVYCVESKKSGSLPICLPLGFVMEEGYNRLGLGTGFRPVQFYFKKNNNII